MPINLSVQKLQEPCYKNTFFKNLKTLLLSDLKKEGPNSLTSQGKLSWLCVRCAQPRTTKKPTKKKRNFLANQSFFCKLPDWKRWAIFHYTKAKRTLISVKSQPLEKRKKLICYSRIVLPSQSKTGLQFLPNSETTEQNLVCLSVATTLVFIRFVHLARKKLSSRFETIIRLLLRKKTTKPSVYSHCWLCT